jgi:penicillin-binding protein 1A
VVSDGVAAEVTGILEDNIRYGTGTRAYFGRTAAGKTGTTDHHADAWFAGYTPELETTVWVGYTKGEIPMENVHGIAVAGGSFPATIWRLFMERALAGRPERAFPEPRQWPTWRSFHRGKFALSYDPYYRPETTYRRETTSTSEAKERTSTSEANERTSTSGSAESARRKTTPVPARTQGGR